MIRGKIKIYLSIYLLGLSHRWGGGGDRGGLKSSALEAVYIIG